MWQCHLEYDFEKDSKNATLPWGSNWDVNWGGKNGYQFVSSVNNAFL